MARVLCLSRPRVRVSNGTPLRRIPHRSPPSGRIPRRLSASGAHRAWHRACFKAVTVNDGSPRNRVVRSACIVHVAAGRNITRPRPVDYRRPNRVRRPAWRDVIEPWRAIRRRSTRAGKTERHRRRRTGTRRAAAHRRHSSHRAAIGGRGSADQHPAANVVRLQRRSCTNAPSSIYTTTTHGCIRLHPDDAKALFASAFVGMRGLITYEPVLLTQTSDGRLLLEVHPDVYRRQPDALAAIRWRASQLAVTAQIDWDAVSAAVRRRDGSPEDVTRR